MTKKQVKKKFRTPIIAVLGHVDHGKTTLLDAIRGTKVQASEKGGITQNTRAHKVNVSDIVSKKSTKTDIKAVTFIDTPGHEAFSKMRSRGARVADIALLVVAADDGVKPQTKEAIKFIQENNLPTIVVCNKIDVAGANSDKIKKELSANNIIIEEYGGDVIFVEVSALKKQGLDNLIESIVLLSEMNELYCTKPVQGSAEGFVLESNLNSKLGSVALVIIKSGNLNNPKFLVAGNKIHKIRAILDENQMPTKETEQGDPIWIIGLDNVLLVGQNLIVFENIEEAQTVIQEKEKQDQDQESIDEALDDTAIFQNLLTEKEDRKTSETNLNIILKADTKGTLEAVATKLEELSFEDARLTIFSEKVGNISESEVEMANDIKGIVIGFQVQVDSKAEVLAKRNKVLVRNYHIIYDLIDEVEAVVKSMIEPEEEIEEVAKAKVKKVFELSDGSFIAGCEVIKGNVLKGYKVYVERNGKEIGEGKITNLKHLKDEVKEVKKGMECGIFLEPQIEIEPNDEIICYKVIT